MAKAATATEASPVEYVVIVGALTLGTGRQIDGRDGKAKNEVIRLLKGDKITAYPNDPRIASHIELGSVVPAETWNGRSPTARDMALRQGGEFDAKTLIATTPTAAKPDDVGEVDPRNVVKSEDGFTVGGAS